MEQIRLQEIAQKNIVDLKTTVRNALQIKEKLNQSIHSLQLQVNENTTILNDMINKLDNHSNKDELLLAIQTAQEKLDMLKPNVLSIIFSESRKKLTKPALQVRQIDEELVDQVIHALHLYKNIQNIKELSNPSTKASIETGLSQVSANEWNEINHYISQLNQKR